jgi:hypothetical protein
VKAAVRREQSPDEQELLRVLQTRVCCLAGLVAEIVPAGSMNWEEAMVVENPW